MDLGKMRLDSVDWIQVAQDRDQWQDFANTAMKFLMP
jgi:hypothetical protein